MWRAAVRRSSSNSSKFSSQINWKGVRSLFYIGGGSYALYIYYKQYKDQTPKLVQEEHLQGPHILENKDLIDYVVQNVNPTWEERQKFTSYVAQQYMQDENYSIDKDVDHGHLVKINEGIKNPVPDLGNGETATQKLRELFKTVNQYKEILIEKVRPKSRDDNSQTRLRDLADIKKAQIQEKLQEIQREEEIKQKVSEGIEEKAVYGLEEDTKEVLPVTESEAEVTKEHVIREDSSIEKPSETVADERTEELKTEETQPELQSEVVSDTLEKLTEEVKKAPVSEAVTTQTPTEAEVKEETVLVSTAPHKVESVEVIVEKSAPYTELPPIIASILPRTETKSESTEPEAQTPPKESKETQTLPKEPETLPQEPETPQTLPKESEEPQILTKEPETPQTLPKESEEPQILTKEPEEPQTLPKEPEEPQTLPKEPESPQTLPKEPESPQTLTKEPESPQTLPKEPESPQTILKEPESPQILLKEPESPPSEPSTPTESLPTEIKPKDLQAALEEIKNELKGQQDLQEQKLIHTMEDIVSNLIDEVIPKVTAQFDSLPIPSTASALSQQMDFTKESTEEIKKHFTDLINAYEVRLESVGTKHLDGFLKHLKKQKRRFKKKLDKVRKEHLNELEKTLIERDNEWREVLESEFQRTESHFSKQSEFDNTFISQETTLELTQLHQKEIQKITQILEKATKKRFQEIENILIRIKKVEDIQDRQYNTILSLFSVHKLHVTIENLQRALNFDEGNLTQDLEALHLIAQNDSTVASALSIIQDHLLHLVNKGVPSVGQLQKSYTQTLSRAQKAALLRDDNLTSWVLANFAYLAVPANARNISENDPFTLLSYVSQKLEKGDLQAALNYLEKLEGFPREEVEGIISDISARLALSHMLEVLSTHSISLVNELVNIQY